MNHRTFHGAFQSEPAGIGHKLRNLQWEIIVLLCAVAGVGFLALYSAGGGNLDPWADRQMVRFGVGLCVMMVVAFVDSRLWFKIAYPAYAAGLVLLVIVEIMGHIGMGAQRWINLGFIQIQPSELMKIFVVLVLARYFSMATLEESRRILFLIPPALFVLVPTGLVLIQPDLGTAVNLMLAGGSVIFLAGAPIWMFVLIIGGGIAALPIGWHFLHDYQKKRVDTFLDPESDPLGAGYHITQSKIALGSGGIEGKGFLQGTQSHLNFLPEKQTDFIFTLWAEEWGLMGGLFLLALYGLLFVFGIMVAMRCRHAFGRFLAMGLIVNFSLYVLINVAMVMGLIPVVGVPLPLVSYGGTAMLSILFSFGLILSCGVFRDTKLTRM